MASINFNAFGSDTQSYDQSDHPGDSILNVNVNVGAVGTKTINITNEDDLPDPITLNQTVALGLLSTQNYNIGENANIIVGGLAGVQVGNTFNYNLSDGSSLTLSPAFINVGLGNTINVDMGDTGTSTFTYDGGGLSLEVSSFPTVTNISEGDQINVVGATSGEYVGGDLIFKNDLGLTVGRFNAPGLDPSKVVFTGGSMTYACFLKGTHIATPNGEVQVETLKAGDKVLTASGGIATVKWLGHRKLHKNRIPTKDAVRAFPILFKKDSISKNIPHRDLTLSPGHHVSFNGTLVPAMMLVNGQTIIQKFDAKVFEYFHIELEQFDIVLAEGVPAESYVDTGNRGMFQNSSEVALNPDFGPAEGRPEIEGIKVVQQGPVVEAIRKQLLKRAESMTGATRTTDAALRVEVNGSLIESTPAFEKEGVYRFDLPENTNEVRIVSRSATVRDVTPLARRDIRQIGVGISRLEIVDQNGRRELDLSDATISGLNAAQDVKGTMMRWTTGSTVVPASVLKITGKATLELTVLRTYTYWIDSQARKEVRAA